MQPGSTVFILTTLAGSRRLRFHLGDVSRPWTFEDLGPSVDPGWRRKRERAFTACGRVRYGNRWEEREGGGETRLQVNIADATPIRLDLACRIAEPCSRCFPARSPELGFARHLQETI